MAPGKYSPCVCRSRHSAIAMSLQHRRCRRGEVLWFYLIGDVLLNQRMSGQVFGLCAECLPDFVETCPCSRITGLYSELNVVENLEFAVAECHFDYGTVVDAAGTGDICFPVGQTVFTTTRNAPVQRFFHGGAVGEIEGNDHLIV